MLTPAQVREIDRRAIEEYSIPGAVLMENAGRAAALEILRELDSVEAARVSILCGPGNNAGDGYVVARYLDNAGCDVRLFSTVVRERLGGDAAWAAEVAARMGLEARGVVQGETSEDGGLADAARVWSSSALVVDALLGTGSTGEPRGTIARVLTELRAGPMPPIVALDLPTGLDAVAGTVAANCVRADRTLTFVDEKTGFASTAARSVLGRIAIIDIGVPRSLVREAQAASGSR